MSATTPKWRRGFFYTKHDGGLWVLRDGWVYPPFATDKRDGRRWDVTHTPSGLRVARGLPRLRDVKDLVALIGPLANWRDPIEMMRRDGLAAVVKGFLAERGGTAQYAYD